jgi:oligogalacturonide transporter
MNKKKVSLPTAVCFGLVDMMGGGAFAIIGSFLLFYYTTFAGLTPVQGASIVAIARFVDAIFSLSMGSITDNFYKNKLGQKFGRRRFFMLIGAPLCAITFFILWLDGMHYLYYLICYLVFEMVAAMVMIPWETLPSEMTTDFNDRTKMSTARLLISNGATFLAAFVPGRIISALGDKNAHAYVVNAGIFAVLFFFCIIISYKATWEREMSPEMKAELEQHQEKEAEHSTVAGIKEILVSYAGTFKLKIFRKHIGIYLAGFTANDVVNTIFMFFCVYALKIATTEGANLLSLTFVGLPCVLISGLVIVKVGPRNLYKFSLTTLLLSVIAYFVIYLTRPSNMIVLLTIVSIAFFIGKGVLTFTPWNVFPFIPDVDEIVTKKRQEGIYAAVMTFTRKSTVALATFIIGIVLQEGGFVQGKAVQTVQATHTIAGLLLIGGGGLYLVALILAFTFSLNKKTHADLVVEVERLKNPETRFEKADEKVQLEIEKMTGYSYDQIWKTWNNQE